MRLTGATSILRKALSSRSHTTPEDIAVMTTLHGHHSGMDELAEVEPSGGAKQAAVVGHRRRPLGILAAVCWVS